MPAYRASLVVRLAGATYRWSPRRYTHRDYSFKECISGAEKLQPLYWPQRCFMCSHTSLNIGGPTPVSIDRQSIDTGRYIKY
jgi:hypothetical protein